MTGVDINDSSLEIGGSLGNALVISDFGLFKMDAATGETDRRARGRING
jgi:hypothetical protein